VNVELLLQELDRAGYRGPSASSATTSKATPRQISAVRSPLGDVSSPHPSLLLPMNLNPTISAGRAFVCAAALIATATLIAAPIDEVYKLGPDSQVQPGVPTGAVTPWEQLPSQAYPGTLHDFCVYVPARSRRASPRP
jgi:hypothetical protein